MYYSTFHREFSGVYSRILITFLISFFIPQNSTAAQFIEAIKMREPKVEAKGGWEREVELTAQAFYCALSKLS